MQLNPWKAPSEVSELLELVKQKHHERLADTSIAVCFEDSKPFINNKLNLGKVTKFSPLIKLWQNKQYEFCFLIPMELWNSILKGQEARCAYLDLMLSRCTYEFMPEEVEENGKKHKVKDEWGRIQYTKIPKLDFEGNKKYKVLPLDLEVFADNVRRYGLWCDQLLDLKEAIEYAGAQNG